MLADPATGNRVWTDRQLAVAQRAQEVVKSLTIGDGTGSAGSAAPHTLEDLHVVTSGRLSRDAPVR